MTIVNQKPPARSRSVVHAELRRRLERSAHIRSLQGSPRTGSPLPLYRIAAGSGSAGAAHPLKRARRIGWQYPLIGGECVGLVLLLQRRTGAKYAGIMEGGMPRRLFEVALSAERDLRDADEAYEPRLLEVPARQLVLLWMRGARGTNWFYPISRARGIAEWPATRDLPRLAPRAKQSRRPAKHRKKKAPRRTGR